MAHSAMTVTSAVRAFWLTRDRQARKQKATGQRDQGARSAVTGGAQMDGFADLVASVVNDSGGGKLALFRKQSVELPGFFRATKEWDIMVKSGPRLVAVIELKSHVGSFGNNFNNRAEEAIGSATDIWKAYREGAFGLQPEPWLGYLLLIEDSPQSRAPVKVKEPHFPVFPDFKDASYARRYEVLCRRLVLERLYRSAAFLTSPAKEGRRGLYAGPVPQLSVKAFTDSLAAHCALHS